MELLLAIFTYLSASLSPAQFLAAIAAFGTAAFFLIRWALTKRKAILSFIKPEDANLKAINHQLEAMATKEEMEAALAKLELILRHELSENTVATNGLTEKFVEISNLRHEIVDKEFEDLRENQRIMLSNLRDSTAGTARIESQLHHVDEYLKAAIPEFRAYHRELASDLKILSRDLALVERSIQLSVTPAAGIKLR